jgi:hypothetical protein
MHSAVLLKDGRVMVTGGFEGGQIGDKSRSVEVYDPAADAWATVD